MKISDLTEKLNFKLITKEDYEDRDITGCYIGDLLSWVMGKANSGDAWLTIMNNINIVAVATLTDVACIILCEGVSLDSEVIEKADSQGVVIVQTVDTAYQTACKISKEV